MLKKHLVLIGLCFSLLFLGLSTTLYPGGSQADKNAVGYDWANNYLCNLFNDKAVNGMDNPARIPAILGMLTLCASFALFFWRFSKKMPSKTASYAVQFSGIGSMAGAFLVVTPYHDAMTTLASVLALIALFYVLFYTLKSKLTALKYLSVACMLLLYLNNYIYYTQNGLAWLPMLQKLSFLTIIVWLLGLEYWATKDSFTPK